MRAGRLGASIRRRVCRLYLVLLRVFQSLYSCLYCSSVLMFSCFLIKGYSEAHLNRRGSPQLTTRKPAFQYADTHEVILGSPMCSEQKLY
jgi:hypothetical protein